MCRVARIERHRVCDGDVAPRCKPVLNTSLGVTGGGQQLTLELARFATVMHKFKATHEALDVFGPWQLKAASLTARLGYSSHRQGGKLN